MSDEVTRSPLLPRAFPEERQGNRKSSPGELFGDRQAWRPRSELNREDETTRSIKVGVLVLLFFCYLIAGIMFLWLAIGAESLSGLLVLLLVPPLFAILICGLTSWVLFPGLGRRFAGGGRRDR